MKLINLFKSIIKLLLIFGLQTPFSQAQAKSSVLQLEVYKQPPNIKNPWQKRLITRSFPIAVKIKYKNQFYFVVLATEIMDNTSIQIRAATKEQKKVSVKWIDHEVNLAVLELSPKFNHNSITAFELAPEVSFKKELMILQVQKFNSFTTKKTKINGLNMTLPQFSAYPFIHYTINNKNSPCNNGAPLFYEQQLVGLCHNTIQNQNQFIPSFTVKKMLQNFVENNIYKGFSDLGFEISKTLSLLRLDHIGTIPSSLKEDDIAIALDNHKLLAGGNIKHKLWGQVNYRYYLDKKNPQQKVSLTVKRNGKPKKVTLKLKKRNSNNGLVRYYRTSKTEPYILHGGLVIQRLSLEYLNLWGKEWRTKAPSQLLNLLNYGSSRGLKGHALLISQVFSDESTRGYDKLKYVFISSVNNKNNLTFKELSKLLQSSKNPNHKFKLMHGNGSIIVNKQEAMQVTKRIKSIYSF